MEDEQLQEERAASRPQVWVLLLAVLVLVALVLAIVVPTGGSFDSNAWKQAQSRQDAASTATRFQMAESLVASGMLSGMARSDVIALLGKDPNSGYFKGRLAYQLGPERSYFAIDSEWLVIRFDGDDRVVDAAIRSD